MRSGREGEEESEGVGVEIGSMVGCWFDLSGSFLGEAG